MSNQVSEVNVSLAADPHELERLRKEWWAFLLLGIMLILGGAACISYPFFTTVGVMVFQGVALMLAGVAIVISAFWTGKWRRLHAAVVGWFALPRGWFYHR